MRGRMLKNKLSGKAKFIFYSAALVLIIAIAFSVWIIFTELSKPRSFYNTGVSDEEYISITNQNPLAQLFLKMYPKASAYVDRSGRLAVDYRIDRAIAVNTTYYLRLRVFVDPETNTTAEVFLNCFNGSNFYLSNPEAIEDYLVDGECFQNEDIKNMNEGDSGFKGVSEDYWYLYGYRYKVKSTIAGPVSAEVNRSKNLSAMLNTGDVVIFYSGSASVISETDDVETIGIGWRDLNVGRIEKKGNSTLKVSCLRPCTVFEEVSPSERRAVLMSEACVSIEKVLYIVQDEEVKKQTGIEGPMPPQPPIDCTD